MDLALFKSRKFKARRNDLASPSHLQIRSQQSLGSDLLKINEPGSTGHVIRSHVSSSLMLLSSKNIWQLMGKGQGWNEGQQRNQHRLGLVCRIKTLRALHLAPTSAGGQKVTTATSCIQLFTASMYGLPIKWKREQQSSEWRFSDDFSWQVTLKNQTEKGSTLPQSCLNQIAKDPVFQHIFSNMLLLKTIKSWTCLKQLKAVQLICWYQCMGNKNLDKPFCLHRQQHAHQALF